MLKDLSLLQTLDYRQKLNQCIHCGLCLQACPTYAVFGTEMDSPRGRIALMRAASQELIEVDDFAKVFTPHIALCLACRACETACPSGVKYGALVEAARVVTERNRRPGLAERFLRWLGTRQLMTKPSLLRTVARLLWIYERIGLQRLVRWLNFLPKTLEVMEGILPPIDLQFTPPGSTAPAVGERRGRVLFFTGCIQDAFLGSVNQATRRVLQRNGYEVFTPNGQTCCGAAHLHLGDVEEAKRLARQNIDVFLALGDDCVTVINNAGGCGVSLKEYPHLLADDVQYAEKARRFAAKVADINEFLAAHLHVAPPGALQLTATYSDSCHLRHGQKVVTPPRELLKKIPGLQLVELSQPDRCCGSAGVYNIAQVDTANAILDAKMADIAATGAELIVTSNTGCYMQLMAGVRRAGLKAKVAHVMEVLEWSYGEDADQAHRLG
jgi:glycolate oxidase iron-sulfur subunit